MASAPAYIGTPSPAAMDPSAYKRVGMVVRLKPECLAEYRRLHDGAGVRDLLVAYHLCDFTIWIQVINGVLYEFASYQYRGTDMAADMAALNAEPRNKWVEGGRRAPRRRTRAVPWRRWGRRWRRWRRGRRGGGAGAAGRHALPSHAPDLAHPTPSPAHPSPLPARREWLALCDPTQEGIEDGAPGKWTIMEEVFYNA